MRLHSLEISMNESPVPNIGVDLMEAEAAGYFEGLASGLTMATLELLRHGEIDTKRAAIILGVSESALVILLRKLPIEDLRRLAG